MPCRSDGLSQAHLYSNPEKLVYLTLSRARHPRHIPNFSSLHPHPACGSLYL